MSLNPYEDAAQQAKDTAKAESDIVLAKIEAISDDETVVAVSNVGKNAKYPARLPAENDVPPVGSTVLVNTSADRPFVQQTMDVPDGETLGGSSGPMTYVQDSKPPESEASVGDHWLNVTGYSPAELWRFESPTSPNSYSGGLAKDDTNVYVGDDEGRVFALDPSDGTINWQVDAGNPISTTIEQDSSSIYFGLSVVDEVRKLSKTDGSNQWTYQHNGTPSGELVIDDTRVYFVEDTNENIVAVDKSTGTQSWSSFINTDGHHQLVHDSNNVYANDTSGSEVFAFDKTDGSTVWSTVTSGFVNEGITGDSDNVYSIGYRLQALDKTDGSIVWQTGELDAFYDYWIVNDSSNVYAVGNDSIVRAFSKSDGSIVWETEVDDKSERSNIGEMAVTSNALFLQHRSGKLISLDTSDGSEIWHTDISLSVSQNADIENQIVVNDGSVYASTYAPYATALNVSEDRYTSESDGYVFDGSYWSLI